MTSPDQAVVHALWPLLHSGALAPAIVWAAAAALLPWIARGPIPVRLVSIVVWSAALASATTTMLRAVHADIAPRPAVVVLGAVAGALIASIPALLSARRQQPAGADTAAGLA
jgi:hypothetical protein